MIPGEDLFSSFEPVSAKTWMERIRTDLKDRDAADALNWLTDEGIHVKPFYTREDLSGRVSYLPGEARPDWHVIEKVTVANVSEANRLGHAALMRGAGSLVFDLLDRPLDQPGLTALTEGILTDIAPVCMTNYSRLEISDNAKAGSNGICLMDDRLIYFLRRAGTGSVLPVSFWSDWRANVGRCAGASSQDLTIDASVYKDTGANHVQELAFALAVGREYLEQLDGAWDRPQKLSGVRIRMGLAGNFFFEIAKLRAVRRLWMALCSFHGQGQIPVYLECVSSGINKSRLDPHGNMLRNTTECMSAVLGGADGVCLVSHDLSGDPMDSSQPGRRWAANISHLLRHESHFDMADDPVSGSFFLESLTDELAEHAWDEFRTIERDGGFIKCWQSGRIESELNRSLSQKQGEMASRKTILVGVNEFPDPSPKEHHMDDEAGGMDRPALRLPPVRLAAPFEALRLRAQARKASGLRCPQIALFAAGKPGMAVARMNFASGFLAVGGLDTVELSKADLPRAGEWNYDLLVLCSDDESWAEWLVKLRPLQSGLLWLAGDPKLLKQEFRELTDGAIFMGCNILESLTGLQDNFYS